MWPNNLALASMIICRLRSSLSSGDLIPYNYKANMEKPDSSGFSEVAHTADCALQVWAPSLDELFIQAAAGLYHLLGVRFQDAPMVTQQISFSAGDDESLLVFFLSELLYIGESQGVAFDRVQVHCDQHTLQAQLSGSPIASQERMIKAVTYHNLSIQRERDSLVATIVFDA
ncbi:archease [bacterium]|nr:MAG: archease [bacterium]